MKFTNSAPTFLSGIRLVILQEEQTQATVVGNVSSNGMDVIFELPSHGEICSRSDRECSFRFRLENPNSGQSNAIDCPDLEESNQICSQSHGRDLRAATPDAALFYIHDCGGEEILKPGDPKCEVFETAQKMRLW